MAKKSTTSGKKTTAKATLGNKRIAKKGGVLVKQLGRSTLVEEDLQHTEHGLTHKEPEHLTGEREPKLFYRKFVFRCGKCVHEFEHEATIPIIEHKVVCPKCSEEHIIRVIPVARHYELKMPKDLTAIKHVTKKK
ncbi:MAG: zinc ribbon domain-containing protein [Candidatus Altiarchaeota archaeon]|nr:zinc ribbon domain-containing protein [Candidatus Altiarchaeota archaeon]